MLLFLSALDTSGQQRDFSLWFDNLELCLDSVNALSKAGNHLLRIEIIDEDSCLYLPVDAFDGTSFTKTLLALEQEWTQLLSYTLD